MWESKKLHGLLQPHMCAQLNSSNEHFKSTLVINDSHHFVKKYDRIFVCGLICPESKTLETKTYHFKKQILSKDKYTGIFFVPHRERFFLFCFVFDFFLSFPPLHYIKKRVDYYMKFYKKKKT